MLRVNDQLREQLGPLLQKTPKKQQAAAIRRSADGAYARKAGEIVQRLREQRALESLGQVDEELKQQIDELEALLPYSREFLHVRLFSLIFLAIST